MIMDECPKNTKDYNLIKESMELSLDWAQKDQKIFWKKPTQRTFWYNSRRFI